MLTIQKIQNIIIIIAILLLLLIVLMFLSVNIKGNRRIIEIGNKIYNYLSKFYIFRSRLYNLKTRIYNNTLDEELIIRYKVIIYELYSLLGGLISAVVVISLFKNNTYVTFTLLFICYQIKEMLLDMLIGNDTQFLSDLQEYGVELQQAFNLTKDVRTAILEANNNITNYNLIKRMEEVEKILDDSIELELYLQDCPNEYLKLLILNCSLVSENGDKKDVDGKSVFLENIFYNNENIETEVFKRKQLEFWLRGLKMICILPLLTFSPYEWWASSYMDVTDTFYKTTKGFMIKLLITVISLVCFYIISSYEKSNRKKSQIREDVRWEDKICAIKVIKSIVLKLVPKYNTPKAYRYNKLISESGEFITIEHIYVQKLLSAIIGFIVLFSVSLSIHTLNKNNIINNLVISEEMQSSMITTQKSQDELTIIENDLFQYVTEDDLESNYKILIEKLEEQGITIGADYIVRDVINKKIKMLDESVSINDILIAMLGIFIGYNIPEIVLKYKAKSRKQEMENEIIIFETIILIFMYHEHGTSELILENMVKFADIFKPQIESILKEFKRSDFKALNELVEEIKYKPFLNIVKNLIKAENIKTKEAFISLSDNRRNYLMNRKEENRKLVAKRVDSARALSMITLDLIIMFYIALPLMYISYVQLDKTQSQIIEIESNSNSQKMEE